MSKSDILRDLFACTERFSLSKEEYEEGIMNDLVYLKNGYMGENELVGRIPSHMANFMYVLREWQGLRDQLCEAFEGQPVLLEHYLGETLPR